MIFVTATVPVNPPGEQPLTIDQIWQGLVLKARDARLFLPPGACTRCVVIDEGEKYIVREATISGVDLSEIVTFEPKSKVSFHQFDSPREGVIVNQLSTDDAGALQLRFYCLIGLRHAEPDGPEEQEEKARFEGESTGYRSALLSTLVRTRMLVREGKLA